MFQAQYLPAGSAVYSPWFARGGDYLRATVEVVSLNGSAGITVTVLTKKRDEYGDGAAVTGSIAKTSVGRSTTTEFGGTTSATGLNDLVRYKFDPGSTSGEWVVFRMLAPSWFDAVK